MTTAPTPAGAPGTEVALADPDVRGPTVLADRVVEKIAARAASEVANTAELGKSMSERLTDRLPGRTAATARAEATVSGRLVQLKITIAVGYPVAVVGVTREVRRHVRETVDRLCEVEVRDVDVVVARLRRASSRRRVL